VQFTHACNQGLAGLLIHLNLKGWIFFRQALQGHGHLILIGFGLRLNRNHNDWLRERDGFENHLVGRIAQGVARKGLFEANNGANLTRRNLGEVFSLIGAHPHQATDALLAPLGRIDHAAAGAEHARIDAHIGETSHIGIGDDLEDQRRERRGIIRGSNLLDIGVWIKAVHRRNIYRRGQIVNHSIQQGLDALVAQRAAAQHRHQVTAQGGAAQRHTQLRRGDLLAFQELQG